MNAAQRQEQITGFELKHNSLPAIRNVNSISQLNQEQLQEYPLDNEVYHNIEIHVMNQAAGGLDKDELKARKVMEFYQRNHGGKKLKQSKTLKNLLKHGAVANYLPRASSQQKFGSSQLNNKQQVRNEARTVQQSREGLPESENYYKNQLKRSLEAAQLRFDTQSAPLINKPKTQSNSVWRQKKEYIGHDDFARGAPSKNKFVQRFFQPVETSIEILSVQKFNQ